MRRFTICFVFAVCCFPPAGDMAMAQVPVGMPIEGYDPPFASTRAIDRWESAYRAGEQARAEQLARAMLRSAAGSGPFALIEARFALALTLDAQTRYTESETQFRLGLSVLRQLLSQGGSGQRAANRLSLVREWAWYFELHLRTNLGRQGRLREGDDLDTFGAREEDADEVIGEPPERVGFGSMVGITSTIVTAGADRTGLTDDQISARNALLVATYETPHADTASQLRAARALALFDAQTYGGQSRQYAANLTRVASIEVEADIVGNALADAAQAVAIYEHLPPTGDDFPYAFAGALLVHARALQAAARVEEALAQVQRAAAMDTAAQPVETRLQIAWTLYQLSDLPRSAILYQRIVDTASLTDRVELQIRSFLGHIAMRQGRYADAIAQFRGTCGRLAELSLQRGRGSRATLESTETTVDLRDCSTQHALTLWAMTPESAPAPAASVIDTIAEAFVASQYAQPDPAAAALSRSAARAVARRGGVADLAEQYEAAIEARDALDAAPPGDWLNALYRPLEPGIAARVSALNTEIADLSGRIATVAPQFWDVRAPRPLDLASLSTGLDGEAALLGDDEALVYFLLPPDARYGIVFAVSRARTAWARLTVDREELLHRVNALRSSIDTHAHGLAPDQDPGCQPIGSQPFDRSAAHELYRILFGNDDIAAVLGPVSTWIIAPTGPLTSLPFSLLVTTPPTDGSSGDDDQDMLRATNWLVRSKAIAILPSVESLRALRRDLHHEAISAQEPLLAFVAPDRGTAPVESCLNRVNRHSAGRSFSSLYRNGAVDIDQLRALPPLQFSWREGEALRIALNAAPQALVSGPQASKAALFRRNNSGELAQVRVLEFSTHGFAAGGYDGLSEPMLVLAAAENADDWILRSSEAASLRLNADWVILSGCNTASADLLSAEGLSGFARAFFLAGTRSLIVSQWQVDDFSARDMIPRTISLYYSRSGLTKAHALRQAMLQLLDQPMFGAAHPAFWSPFILVGDPD